MDLLDHMVILFNLVEIIRIFSRGAAYFTFPEIVHYSGFQCPHILTTSCYFLFFDSSHPDGYEVVRDQVLTPVLWCVLF